jgi:hypothetical protein
VPSLTIDESARDTAAFRFGWFVATPMPSLAAPSVRPDSSNASGCLEDVVVGDRGVDEVGVDLAALVRGSWQRRSGPGPSSRGFVGAGSSGDATRTYARAATGGDRTRYGLAQPDPYVPARASDEGQAGGFAASGATMAGRQVKAPDGSGIPDPVHPEFIDRPRSVDPPGGSGPHLAQPAAGATPTRKSQRPEQNGLPSPQRVGVSRSSPRYRHDRALPSLRGRAQPLDVSSLRLPVTRRAPLTCAPTTPRSIGVAGAHGFCT